MPLKVFFYNALTSIGSFCFYVIYRYYKVSFLLATICVTLRECASNIHIIHKSVYFVHVYGGRWGLMFGSIE